MKKENHSKIIEPTEAQLQGEFFKDINKVLEITEAHTDSPPRQFEFLLTALSTQLMRFVVTLNLPMDVAEKIVTNVFNEGRDGAIHALKEHHNQ